MNNNLLTRTEVAEYLRVSARTISTMMKTQGLPHFKTGEGRSCKVFFPRDQVDAWVAKRSQKSAPLPASDEVRRRPRRQVV